MADPLKERIARLQIGAAKGVLKPEHQAELERYVSKGLVKGQGPQDTATTTNVDKEALIKASERGAAADKSLRLYSDVRGAVNRFDPGPHKAQFMDAVLPNEDGGFWDTVGSVAGLPLRPFISQQSIDDRDRINSARAERIGIRAQEQAGVQAKNDEIQFKLADISPYKSKRVNNEIIDRAVLDAGLQKVRAKLEAGWVSRYGSTATASPNGTTFQAALDQANNHYLANPRGSKPRAAPPSKRSAPAGGWSAQRVD